jgi:hypothetical protein
MQARLNGEPQDMQITLKRHDPRPSDENLYVNDVRVARVTHSLSDEIPVILALENEAMVEVDRQTFYTIGGMDPDWQPGTQPDALSGG